MINPRYVSNAKPTLKPPKLKIVKSPRMQQPKVEVKPEKVSTKPTLRIKTSPRGNPPVRTVKQDYLSKLPLDLVVALKLPLSDLNSLCRTNKEFRKLCDNEDFWKRKTLLDLGNFKDVKNWKQFYLNFGQIWGCGVIIPMLEPEEIRIRSMSSPIMTFGKPNFDIQLNNVPNLISNIRCKAVSSKIDFNLFIDMDDNVWQLGDLYSDIMFKTLTKIPDLKAKKISAGAEVAMIIDMDNNVWSYGRNDAGQAGHSDEFKIIKVPTKILGIKAKEIAVGGLHSVILDIHGNVWTFGANNLGQLGQVEHAQDNFKYNDVPTKLKNVKAKKISCGSVSTLFIDTDSNVWGFGSNRYGQLGLGLVKIAPIPKKIPNLKAKDISCGTYHSFVTDLDNNAWGFGENQSHQLGVAVDVKIPIKLLNLKVKEISAGDSHTLFIDLNDNVLACGENVSGELGLGRIDQAEVPTKIPNFKASHVAAGRYYSVFLKI